MDPKPEQTRGKEEKKAMGPKKKLPPPGRKLSLAEAMGQINKQIGPALTKLASESN